MENVYLVLYNVRSAHNVGSILRTADGAGIKKVYLCGYTPTPVDRFGRKRKDIAKVALGAEESVSVEYVACIQEILNTFKEEGRFVVALEQDESSISYTSFLINKPTAIVVGEETEGIPQHILQLCDSIVEIPMYGKKESLNVSIAAGIILFELTKQFS